jgi:hypothetical protein
MKQSERVIVGPPESFMTVRHLRLEGTQRDIGFALGTIARDRHGASADTLRAPDVAEARCRYLKALFPAFAERMSGAADALGITLESPYDLSGLAYNMLPPGAVPGCSAIYLSPDQTTSGHAILSRNYDFPRGTIAEIMGLDLPNDVQETLRPMMADPYVMELVPTDGGLASISMVAFDLLGGALGGVNEAGLVICLNGDEIAISQGIQPDPTAVGINEVQLVRYVLDTCRTVNEARAALEAADLCLAFLPCHYLIGDASGSSMIFEMDYQTGNKYTIPTGDAPPLLLNHPVRTFASSNQFPPEATTIRTGTSSFERQRHMEALLREIDLPISTAQVRALCDEVAVDEVIAWIPEPMRLQFLSSPGLSRTLWQINYDATARRVEAKFYLGDREAGGSIRQQFTNYASFQLES